MNPKTKPVGRGKMVAEGGSKSLIEFFKNWWALFVLGILLILLGIAMLYNDWLEVICCFLASGSLVVGIGFALISLGFLMPKTPFPSTPLGKVIAAGISGIIAFIMIFIVPLGVQ